MIIGSAAATVGPVRPNPELEAALTARAESDAVAAGEAIRRAPRVWHHAA